MLKAMRICLLALLGVLNFCIAKETIDSDQFESAKDVVSKNEPLQTRCARIKLKSNCIDQTRDWFSTLMSQKDEVLKILKEQGVYVEAVFLDHIGEDHYLIYFMKEENTKKSLEVSSLSKHPINERHREYKKNCWEEKIVLENLLDLDRIKD